MNIIPSFSLSIVVTVEVSCQPLQQDGQTLQLQQKSAKRNSGQSIYKFIFYHKRSIKIPVWWLHFQKVPNSSQ